MKNVLPASFGFFLRPIKFLVFSLLRIWHLQAVRQPANNSSPFPDPVVPFLLLGWIDFSP